MFAFLFCVAIIVYWPALSGSLLWDDDSHLTRPELQSTLGLWRIWSDARAVPQYYPLLHSAFWFEYQLWGDRVLGYHLTNIVLHVIAAGLLVLVVKRLSLPGAWLAGFVFALHPIQVETVAWISEQKSTLSAVFYLAAALTYLYFDQTRRRTYYLAASGLFLLALLSKTVTATLPAVLLVIFWWQRGRISWKRDVAPLLPWFAVGATAGVFTAWVERTLVGALGADYSLTPLQHFLLAGRVIWFYLGKLIWPANLMFTYPRWVINPSEWWQFLFPAGILVALIGLALMARRHRGPLAGFLIFAGTLFPVLGFLNVYPFRYSYVADHFQYLAGLGVIVPAASGLALIAHRVSAGKSWGIGIASAFVAILGFESWQQCHIYRDAETLYRETLVRNPKNWMAYNNLGHVLAQAPERLPDAIAEYEKALQIRADVPEIHLSLAGALAQMPGRTEEAVAQYKIALRMKPDYWEAHLSFAKLLSHLPGRLTEAIPEYEAALRSKPDSTVGHLNLGNVYVQLPGRLPDAIAEYEAALKIWPDYAEAHYNLGSALAQIPGRTAEAVAQFQAALRSKPDLESARQAIEILSENSR